MFLHLSVILLTGPLSGGRHPPGRPAADGTHPTRMHSCYFSILAFSNLLRYHPLSSKADQICALGIVFVYPAVFHLHCLNVLLFLEPNHCMPESKSFVQWNICHGWDVDPYTSKLLKRWLLAPGLRENCKLTAKGNDNKWAEERITFVNWQKGYSMILDGH